MQYSENEIEFLRQSNYIEMEYSDQALKDAKIAWNYFSTQADFNMKTLLTCHNLLMQNLEHRIAGKIRQKDVQIGGCLKPFINRELIRGDLNHVFSLINASIKLKKAGDKVNEKVSKDLHIQFEYIHPFADGNGRVGRILWQVHRMKLDLPIHIIYEKDKYEYYKWFTDG